VGRSLVVLICLVSLIATSAPLSGADTGILSGRVDATNASASRWVSTDWVAPAADPTTLRLEFASPAEVRIDVRRVNDGAWIGAELSGANPKLLSVPLDVGVTYRIAVWALSGASNFSVVHVQSNPPPDDPLFSGRVDNSNATAIRWTASTWIAAETKTAEVAVTWETPSADLRAAIRRKSDYAWVANLSGGAGSISASVPVLAGVEYELAVWAFSGASDFAAFVDNPVTQTRPNILVIMTDDQRRDSMVGMPKVMRWMADGGTEFTEGYVTTPACCPARAGVLTGRYNHNNGVVSQGGPPFDEDTSIAKYLGDAGYATAHVGKYVHYLDLHDEAPYWDKWTYYQGGYDNVPMNFDGTVELTNGYATNIAFDKAIEYVSDFEASDDNQPWLMHVWPTAPHRVGNNPPSVELQYQNAAVAPFVLEPRSFEADVSDKPSFMYCCPNLTSPAYIENVRAQMIRALYSVDDGVDELLTHLQQTGELDNTLVFFLSDNGWMFGDHRLHEKFVPYENSVGVPFLMRWPGHIAPGAVSDRFVSNIDILPTALAAAGVAIPGIVDGQDILGEPPRPRRFTEYFHDLANIDQVKSWAAVATTEHQYIEWYNANGSLVFREFYYRQSDPFQLLNVLGDSIITNDPDPALVAQLAAQIAADRACAGISCP
jgi:arylsulfatase A-like enzyme